MTDATETDASFLATVSGAGFWSVCQGYYFSKRLALILDGENSHQNA